MVDYATLLRDHVVLECRSIDRIFLQAWVPKLQLVGMVCRFLLRRGLNIPSSAAFGKVGDAFVGKVHRWARPTWLALTRICRSATPPPWASRGRPSCHC